MSAVFLLISTVVPSLQGRPPAGALGPLHVCLVESRCEEPTWIGFKDVFFFFLCFKGVSIEAMSENKMASSEFSSGPVEKAAKPLPFKDPNFVVSI